MNASFKKDTSLDATTHKRLCPSLGTSIRLSVCIRSCVRPQVRPFVRPSIGPLVRYFHCRHDHDQVALEVSLAAPEAWLRTPRACFGAWWAWFEAPEAWLGV